MHSDFLILGSTGLLGQALISELKERNFSVKGIARENADINIDVTNKEQFQQTLEQLKPKYIINTIAIVNLNYCEENPDECYEVNTNVSAILSEHCHVNNIKYIFISTDHYFTGDNEYKHPEDYPLNLCNEYAISKQLAEELALKNDTSLVIRTNIVGFRHLDSKPTFVEWIIDSLKNQQAIQLFNDFYTSSIDVKNFSKIVCELIDKNTSGLLNVASSEVSSKEKFVILLAHKFNFSIKNTTTCSIHSKSSNLKRNESLGLDVSKAEKILGYQMPTLNDVINSLANEYFIEE
jgi:dTDP-4-dehydrorhamnose reductase